MGCGRRVNAAKESDLGARNEEKDSVHENLMKMRRWGTEVGAVCFPGRRTGNRRGRGNIESLALGQRQGYI